MLLLRFIVFLLILLFQCAAFSQALPTKHITADEVFFGFVDQHTEDFDATMGPTWLDEILEHTESWAASDATELLNSLEVSSFPTPHILTILKNTQSLQRIQKQLNNSEFQTGSDVFIDYVRNYFRKKLQEDQPNLEEEALEEAFEGLMLRQMPSLRNKHPWEERIHNDAQSWSTIDAILFLDDLENEWGMDADTIIKRLNATTFFKLAHYISFTLRLEVYTEYFGKDHVKKILDKTFMPFERGEVHNIRAMLDAVITYFNFEKDLMIEILSNNLQLISNNSLDLFNRRVSWLEGFLGKGDRNRGKDEIKEFVREKKSLNIIRSVNIKINRKTDENETEFRVNFLRSRAGYNQEDVIDSFKKNPQAFLMGDLSTDKISYLEKLLGVKGKNGREQLDWVIQNKSLQGIVNFKIYKNEEDLWENEYVKFLNERELSPENIADLFKSDPEAFSKGDLSADKITYLEELLEVDDKDGKRDGKAQLGWVIKNRSFQGIVNFRVYKNREGLWENKSVKFLKNRGFTPLQIADLFKSDPQAFSRGDLSTDKITYLEEYLGKGDRNKGKKKLDQIILKRGGFKALSLFKYNNNTQVANRIIDFLENRLHFKQDQVIRLMENHFSEFFVGTLTEATSKEYIEKLMEKVPDMCAESLLQKKAS